MSYKLDEFNYYKKLGHIPDEIHYENYPKTSLISYCEDDLELL